MRTVPVRELGSQFANWDLFIPVWKLGSQAQSQFANWDRVCNSGCHRGNSKCINHNDCNE